METSSLFNRFSDKLLAEKIIRRVRDLRSSIQGTDPVPLMEVCGTHAHVLGKSGIRDLLSDVVEFRSGPGCPVCVTDAADLEMLIDFSLQEEVVLAVFGDLLRVPCSRGNLLEQKAKGARIHLVYSALDALEIARERPREQVVFVGAGFETTAPGTALAILEAQAAGLQNFCIISLHKIMPPVLRLLLTSGSCNIGGLILPGHVATITGRLAFDFIASELGFPAVISGFEPLDVLHATALLLEMLADGRSAVVNGYSRAVSEQGNTLAIANIEKVFENVGAVWRGFGFIEGSGLGIKSSYADFDACRRFGLTPDYSDARYEGGCRCGEVLRGEITPRQCPLFGSKCTPAQPQGACMVSGEGACSSYF